MLRLKWFPNEPLVIDLPVVQRYFDHIRKCVSIVTVVGDLLVITKEKDGNFSCKCPFHVNRGNFIKALRILSDREYCYCFICHSGGDVISFYAKAFHLTELEAAQELNKKYRCEAPELPAIITEKEPLSKEVTQEKIDSAIRRGAGAQCIHEAGDK